MAEAEAGYGIRGTFGFADLLFDLFPEKKEDSAAALPLVESKASVVSLVSVASVASMLSVSALLPNRIEEPWAVVVKAWVVVVAVEA